MFFSYYYNWNNFDLSKKKFAIVKVKNTFPRRKIRFSENKE